MKFRQEFRVSEPLDAVWRFFEQPLGVAECIPGVETADAIEPDRIAVRITQKLGPMSATFEAKVRITERVAGERIAFTSTGKAVRGAVGNFRTTNLVLLRPAGVETDVVVQSDAALAGVLGAIGHKVIAKQAEKVTAAFAENLQRALSGTSSVDSASRASIRSPASEHVGHANAVHAAALASGGNWWTKAAAIFSAATMLIGLLILWRVWG